MKIKKVLFSALLATASLSGFAQAIETPPADYILRWSDEFDGDKLNERNWNYETGNGNWGFGNGELEYYTNRPENVKVADGKLVITAKREDYNGFKFTSGRINGNSKVYFKHGVIQAKIKFPKTANGLWPAYWMMGNDINKYGWPKCGEMDIVEMGFSRGIETGWQDRYFGGTLHWGVNNDGHRYMSQDFEGANNNYTSDYSKWPAVEDGEWHVITVDWDASKCRMYLDLEGWNNPRRNKAVFASFDIPYDEANKDPEAPGTYFHKPFYFLLNVAVGGTYTGIMNADGITCFNDGDKQMEVDWVRVYQKEDDEVYQYYYTDDNGNEVTNIPPAPEPPHRDDNVTELSSFATLALDEAGESTFDFDDVEDVVLISTSEGVTGNFASRDVIRANYNVDNVNNFLYLWENTYESAVTSDRVNSFGWEEGYNRFAVTTKGWSGLGFASTGKGKDLSMLDESYWLHFAMKADDPDIHTSHTVTVGDASFRVGVSDGASVSFGDFKRDGKWYYFDIPMAAILELAAQPFGTTQDNYLGNVIAFLSGGLEGAELDFDNIFFYKSKTKLIPTFTDMSADLGKYGYKSLDEDGNPVFSFDNADNVTPIILSGDMWEHLTAAGTYENSIVKQENDFSEQAAKNNFFIWGDTFTASPLKDTPNSFGNTPYDGFNVFKSAIGPKWNGMGWASISGQGNTVTAKDLSKIDNTYCLHLSLRSDAAVGHVPVTIKLGSEGADAAITLGSYSVSPIFADFNRDGEWYSFDIPVALFKKYGKLWSAAGTGDNGPLNAFTGYVLCINTGQTYYSGSGISIDNVFFYQPKDQSIIPPTTGDGLGEYTTKSLDENGKSYFDFTDKQFFPITAGAAELEAMGEENIIGDLSINDQKTHLYFWEGTYETGNATGINSFGNEEGWIDAVVTDKGWSGLGIISDDGYNLSEIDDSTYFHFALRSTSETYDYHFILGKAHFTIGYAPFMNVSNEVYPVLGNLKRDGEWYSFDIPVAEFKKINTNLWNGQAGCFKDNLFCAEIGATKGNELQLDNMFFWRNKRETTGIVNAKAEVGKSNANTGIFDLCGRKVSSMVKPGLYIVRTANNVRKVIVK